MMILSLLPFLLTAIFARMKSDSEIAIRQLLQEQNEKLDKIIALLQTANDTPVANQLAAIPGRKKEITKIAKKKEALLHLAKYLKRSDFVKYLKE